MQDPAVVFLMILFDASIHNDAVGVPVATAGKDTTCPDEMTIASDGVAPLRICIFPVALSASMNIEPPPDQRIIAADAPAVLPALSVSVPASDVALKPVNPPAPPFVFVSDTESASVLTALGLIVDIIPPSWRNCVTTLPLKSRVSRTGFAFV